MQAGRPASCVLAALLLVACTGGQSGTETPAPYDDGGTHRRGDGGQISITHAVGPCACSLAPHDALLRVTLVELDACRVRARVDEVLAVAPDVELDVDAGGELDVPRHRGCDDAPELGEGDAALLVYAPPVDAAGEGSALVATWGSEHVFGKQGEHEVALPERERERLLDAQTCAAWFGEQERTFQEATPQPDECPAAAAEQ